MSYGSSLPILASMLEGYTSERLRNLIALLNDPELSESHLSSTWIDPRRVPMDVLVSLQRRNLYQHINTIINFVIENRPNRTRMSLNSYKEKKNNLISQLRSVGIIYEDGILRTVLPNPSETNQNIREIKYLLNQHNFNSIYLILEDFLSDYGNNPNSSLGKLRLVFENVVNEIVVAKGYNTSLNIKQKIEKIQQEGILPIHSRGKFIEHFYGIYANLSEWGTHGTLNDNVLLDYMIISTINGILVMLKKYH